MDISTLTPLTSGPVGRNDAVTNSVSEPTAGADFDSFLTLLTAQLQNQDPLSPLDPTEFVAQLASFSQVEQLVSANSKLDALSAQSLSIDIAAFTGWIGKDVAAQDGTFRANGTPVEFSFPAAQAGQQIRASIKNGAGTPISEFVVPAGAGETATWDGTDINGRPVTGEDLTIELEYVQGASSIQTLPAQVLRTVTGLHGTANGLILDLADGGTLQPSTVVRVQDRTLDPA